MSSPPTTLGQYQIIREIARSNDIVYEAYDPLMNRRVAVKELNMPTGATSQQQEERSSRFLREAQAAGTLNHRNIMTVFSLAEDAGRTFMAMEYLDGCTLRNELDTKGFLPLDRAIEIALEVLYGLEHAHSKGVIHRDIKPDNIQILSNGQVKITDFGIARLTFQPNLTMDGQVFGTPSYMSPEQVVGKDIDARSDIFSLGVVLYEMICGQKPFAGDSVVSITYAIMNKEPVQPSQANWQLWQVLQKSLEKSAPLRYGSATEMIAALEGIQRQMQSGSPMLDPNPQTAYSPQMPYGAAIMNQPYDPYGQGNNPAPPMPGVFTQPYGQGAPPTPPPIAYGFSPYQATNQANYPAQPPMPAGFMPPGTSSMPGAPPNPFPVYYPPPPRQPLFKPDTILVFKKVAIVALLLGTAIFILISLLNAYATVSDRQRREEHDRLASLDAVKPDSNLPLQDQIARLEQVRAGLQSDSKRAEVSKNIANLYTKQSETYVSSNDLPRAENALQQAKDFDPNSGEVHRNLGKLYGDRAAQESNVEEKRRLLTESAAEWQKAETSDSDPDMRKSDRQSAANAFYALAQDQAQAGGTASSIRESLVNAKDMVLPGTDLASQIDQALAQYR